MKRKPADDTTLRVLDASTAHMTRRDSDLLRFHCPPQTDADILLKRILDTKALLPTLMAVDPDLDRKIAEALEDRPWKGPTYHCYEEGFWIHVPGPNEMDEVDDWDLSDCFKDLVRYAKDYDWIHLDADGAFVPTLKDNNW